MVFSKCNLNLDIWGKLGMGKYCPILPELEIRPLVGPAFVGRGKLLCPASIYHTNGMEC